MRIRCLNGLNYSYRIDQVNHRVLVRRTYKKSRRRYGYTKDAARYQAETTAYVAAALATTSV